MVILGYLIMLFFCGALTFMVMTFIIGNTNVHEEDKDPAQFHLSNISYEAKEEFGMDYRTALPKFMSRYGYDHKAFPDK